MALLERVATLIRANIVELIERSEDPDKMMKQVILDMRNQLLQVKTQVAIAIADDHLLKKKKKEQDDKADEWMRLANVAVDQGQDQTARVYLDKSLSARAIGVTFQPQINSQSEQVENLKSALLRLQQKLAETESQTELLLARQRRLRMLQRAAEARARVEDLSEIRDAAEQKVAMAEAIGMASMESDEPTDAERSARTEREGEIERILADMRSKTR